MSLLLLFQTPVPQDPLGRVEGSAFASIIEGMAGGAPTINTLLLPSATLYPSPGIYPGSIQTLGIVEPAQYATSSVEPG